MNLRKEQVLLLITVVVGALVYKSLAGDSAFATPRFAPKTAEYKSESFLPALLADNAAIPVEKTVARDLWREPSETQPLPPVTLPFPPRAQMSLAALPLPLGPDFGHLHLLRLPGDPVEGVTLTATPPAAGPAQAPETPEAESTPQDKRAQMARIYDRLWPKAGGSEFFGTLELAPGVDKYEIEARTDFSDLKVMWRNFNMTSGKLEGVIPFEPGEVTKIRLADTLRNEIERRKRQVPKDNGHKEQRGQLIEWLLQQSRQELWVYDEAMAEAELYIKLSGGDLEGLQWKVRVLRRKGDITGELQLFTGLSGLHANSAFQAEGLGLLHQKLGLWREAEKHLRHAVELAPIDARPRASLAQLLFERNRTKEALEQAVRACAGINGAPASDRQRIANVTIGCQLAEGDIAGARSTLATIGESATSWLRACVDYAAGDAKAALTNFVAAAAAGDGPAATLGQGACMLWLGQWQDAQAAFEAVNDQAPLLRHRACTGLALLSLRIGQRDQAMGFLDRALEASPNDIYAHYLRGRVLREQGQLAQALDEMNLTLRAHDDFVYAIAEVALLRAQMAREGAAAQQAENSLAAKLYMDRAVDLARPPLLELLQLQGILRFDAADLPGAAAAFGAALQATNEDASKLLPRAALALCDYAQGGVEEARTQLQRMSTDLKEGAPMRVWADDTLARIDDHSQKEQLDDHFERAELGKVWVVDRDGTLGALIKDGELAFSGKATKAAGTVSADRDGAIKKGGNFLAVEVRMKVLPGHARNDGFVGLRLETQKPQGASVSDFTLKFGLRDGKPFYRLQDGRNPPVQAEFKLADFKLDDWQTLQVRVVPIGDQGRAFGLVLLWNGQTLLDEPRKLERLDRNTPSELRTGLIVESGKRDAPVEVRFDEYHLERRKEN